MDTESEVAVVATEPAELPKKVSFKLDGTKLSIGVDLNQDGENFITVIVDIKEMPEEVWAAYKSFKN